MTTTNRSDIVHADKKYVWHPYTSMDRYVAEVDPLVIHRAEGSRLYDVDGTNYIDANSSWWVATLGHNHPRLVQALTRQAQQLCHTSLAGVTHENAALLAQELVHVAPKGLEKVFYSDNGSTAVEAALKLALKFWHNEGQFERKRFVAFDGAFHGETVGASSLCGVEIFRRPFAGVLLECIFVPPPERSDPNDDTSYARAFDALERLVGEGKNAIAAVVLEPLVQGAAGMRMYDAAYLKHAREVCDRHDVLLIIDEVFTGYGRTGGMWACDAAGISPDIMCLAKGFTGGVLPMSATMTNARVFDAFLGPPERAFHHGHSYCGNPLGAAVAREVLRVFQDEQVLERAAPKATRIATAFEAMRGLPGVVRTRSCGMIGALDMSADAGYLGGIGWRVYAEARKRGAYLRPLGDVVYVAPPVNIADADLDTLLNIVEESVRAAMRA